MLTYDDNFCEAFQKETLPGQEINNKLGLVKLLELKYKQLHQLQTKTLAT